MYSYKPAQSAAKYIPKILKKGIVVLSMASLPLTAFGLTDSTNLSKHLNKPEMNVIGYRSAVKFMRQYKDEISNYSRAYNVPIEAIGGILFLENYKRTRFDDLWDFLAVGKTAEFWDKHIAPHTREYSIFGYQPKFFCSTDPSLGPAQIKISTAYSLDKKFGKQGKTRGQLENGLDEPKQNLEYLAMSLSDISHRRNRASKMQNGVLDDPHLVAVIGTEYRRGATNTPLENAVSSLDGYEVVELIGNADWKAIFGDASTITTQQQARMMDYAKRNGGKPAPAARYGKKHPQSQKAIARSRC